MNSAGASDFYAVYRAPFAPFFLTLDGFVAKVLSLTPPALPEGDLPRLWRAALDAYFAGAADAFARLRFMPDNLPQFSGCPETSVLPVCPSGTPFQQRVWGLLCRLPYGCTKSYGELAGIIGTAARPLARACARNPLPVIIPCHRVITAGGLPGGYSFGGSAVKIALLRGEGVTIRDGRVM